MDHGHAAAPELAQQLVAFGNEVHGARRRPARHPHSPVALRACSTRAAQLAAGFIFTF
jgi:hypothetical protein